MSKIVPFALGTLMFITVYVIGYFTKMNNSLLGFWFATIIYAFQYLRMDEEERKNNKRFKLGTILFVTLAPIFTVLFYIIEKFDL